MRYILLCISLFFATPNNIFSKTHKPKRVITNPKRADGFGAQFQTIIATIIYARLTGKKFVYTPFTQMEHNYDNDPDFLTKKEWLINFIGNYELNQGNAALPKVNLIHFFEAHLDRAVNSRALKKIKRIFRANKNINDYFNNDNLNIVIHVRRPNSHDSRVEGTNTSDEIFLNVINTLRILYAFQKPLFHLHSQGKHENFERFKAEDIILHLNESTEDSFTAMVLADVLVTSASSMSYVAGILSDGIVYYTPFWHAPLPHWISIETL